MHFRRILVAPVARRKSSIVLPALIGGLFFRLTAPTGMLSRRCLASLSRCRHRFATSTLDLAGAAACGANVFPCARRAGFRFVIGIEWGLLSHGRLVSIRMMS